MNYLSKEFKVAVAIYDITIIQCQEATKARLNHLTPTHMNSGEVISSLHFLESWGIVKRRIPLNKIVHYVISEADLQSIQLLHHMCWGNTKTG